MTPDIIDIYTDIAAWFDSARDKSGMERAHLDRAFALIEHHDDRVTYLLKKRLVRCVEHLVLDISVMQEPDLRTV